jgi:hypothetical protein
MNCRTPQSRTSQDTARPEQPVLPGPQRQQRNTSSSRARLGPVSGIVVLPAQQEIVDPGDIQ